MKNQTNSSLLLLDLLLMVETLESQLPTLRKYIGRIQRQQTEDKDCIRWDLEVPSISIQIDRDRFVLYPLERSASITGARSR